jgi:hypothetical protein
MQRDSIDAGIGVRLRVDSAGRGSLDFLDDNGRVTFSVPDSIRR